MLTLIGGLNLPGSPLHRLALLTTIFGRLNAVRAINLNLSNLTGGNFAPTKFGSSGTEYRRPKGRPT